MNQANEFLSEDARQFDPYSADEVLSFWQDEIGGPEHSLDAVGFQGEWITTEGVAKGQDFVFVHPVLPDGPDREAIWVVRESGVWKIAALFKVPPE